MLAILAENLLNSSTHTEKILKEWAREQAEKVIRENWPNCIDSIDWDSLDYEKVSDE